MQRRAGGFAMWGMSGRRLQAYHYALRLVGGYWLHKVACWMDGNPFGVPGIL